MTNIDFTQLNAVDRKKVKEAIEEGAGLMRIQKDKGEQIKDIIDMMTEFGISKKLGRQAITIHHKDNYAETTQANAVLELLMETVFDTNGNSIA